MWKLEDTDYELNLADNRLSEVSFVLFQLCGAGSPNHLYKDMILDHDKI